MRLESDVFPAWFALEFQLEQVLLVLDIGKCATIRDRKREREAEKIARNCKGIGNVAKLLVEFPIAIAAGNEINEILYVCVSYIVDVYILLLRIQALKQKKNVLNPEGKCARN